MAGAATSSDVLSRVRREQRTHGKSSTGSGLRIVLAATGITVALLLFAFGAIGMLMMARSPQEPIVSKLDIAPPAIPQAEIPRATPQAELAPPANSEPEVKAVKTLRVIAPPASEKNDAVAQQNQVPASEPETTSTITPPSATQQQPQVQQQVPQRVYQQRPAQQQQAVRRQVPNSQTDNPLFQLFGIKQYR